MPSLAGDICPDCGKTFEIGDFPFGCGGMGHIPGPFYTGNSQLHDSDKVVIEHNPRTGVTHIPGQTDKPMHPKKVADGFVRQTLNTTHEIRQFEKRSGKISEVLNYNKNSALADRDTSPFRNK
jgi:hypothetical protein